MISYLFLCFHKTTSLQSNHVWVKVLRNHTSRRILALSLNQNFKTDSDINHIYLFNYSLFFNASVLRGGGGGLKVKFCVVKRSEEGIYIGF
jgi:hypothetical protein